MAMPSDTERENCHKFAKFCFRVIKNECSNIKRAAGIRKDYDATGEVPVYRYTETGKERVYDHPLYYLLHDEPKPEMTSFVFRETLMSHLLI